MADAENLKLDELAEQTGVSPRTVRYYVQRGLLPAPAFKGKDSAYGREHMVRLRAIKRMQEQFLPLDAIQEALGQRSLDQIEALSSGRDAIAPVAPVVRPRAPVLWERLSLAPGLELHVADDATEEVKELAQRIRELAAPTRGRPDGRGGAKR